jgi:glycosyltransferase involved in cell wall biosynthesis
MSEQTNLRPKLLFITQKIHQNDDDLAFVILWVKAFIQQGMDVKVICLQKGDFDDSFPVYSLGKEKGNGKIKRTLLFLKYILTLDYDRVFVHMNTQYVTVGGWYWFLKRIPIYLWYTHYAMHFHMWLTGLLSRRMFAATVQSLPQYNGNPKKVILGHGIDVDHWLKDVVLPPDEERSEKALISVHRLCRSKRLERVILALKLLPDDYTLTVYGRDVEKDYAQELYSLVAKENLGSRVKFMGPVPMDELKKVYPHHRLMINMAPETIDKTTLESMVFGVFPVTTPGNSQAIGLPICPKAEEPQDIADFILGGAWKAYGTVSLQQIVRERHSLPVLVERMCAYIKPGN